MSDRRIPKVGETWRSRDPRDNGLEVKVLHVTETDVWIERFRTSRVGLWRFHRDYEFLRGGKT